ncbi:MAG: glycosyltransferase family 2 protein [Patescibacteria group bacterium]|nr:glycosyltransferase family 2 protein [Patescibacteria group bacterium]
MRKYSLSMVVPAYNEEELLGSFIRKSMRDLAIVSNDFEIILVNDGSTDRTLEIASKLAQEYSNLKIINLEKNLGTGKSIIPGFAAASKEIVFNNTVDAFFNTEDLPLLLQYLDKYDVVSGYRSDLSAHNLYQKILTLGNYFLIRLLFGIPLKAYQTVQLHRRSFLQNITIEGKSSFISPELLYKSLKKGLKIKEVKIRYYPRLAGKAKGGHPKNILRTAKDILKFWFLWKILGRIKG